MITQTHSPLPALDHPVAPVVFAMTPKIAERCCIKGYMPVFQAHINLEKLDNKPSKISIQLKNKAFIALQLTNRSSRTSA